MSINASGFKAIRPWLGEVWYAWVFAAVVGFALVISFLLCRSEPAIRLSGLILQLLGILTVIWGIQETRALFGHPSFRSKIKAWLSRFPLLLGNDVHSAGSFASPVPTMKGRSHTTHVAGANPTIEVRLDALEKNLTSIHERIDQTQKEMDEELHKITNAVKREEQLRQAEDNAIRVRLEATGTGGVHISFIGAILLFVGIFLSTAGTEIAALLK